jgi:hypothetical protein
VNRSEPEVTFNSHNSYRDFDRAVRREFRYARTAQQEEFLKTVAGTSHARSLTMEAGYVLWRAQLGHDWREEQQGDESFEVQAAHPPARMKPLADKASDGRANPRGIACLYLATQKETAVLEVRPLIGSYVSVAQFRVLKDLRLVDCSSDETGNLARFLKKDWTPEEVEKQVWSDINRAFSEPVERGDDSLDYIPTQIITETFKVNGFDGIAYKSSYGEDGFNVALFDVGSADVINCGLYRIKDVSVTLSEQDNPYFISRYHQAAVSPPAPDAEATS